MKKVLIIVGIVLVVGGLGGFLFWQDYKSGALETGELPAVGQEFEDEGREHIAVGAEHKSYATNPPTSGPHYAEPAAWGAYVSNLPDEQLIHNLEHGGIWISYKDIDEDTKAKLQDIARARPGGVILTPREANDAKIVLASWRRMEKLEMFDRDKIETFIKHNINKSPEPLAR